MASSITRREAATVALLAVLTDNLPGITVKRSMRRVPEEEDCPIVVLFGAGHTVQQASNDLDAYTYEVHVEGTVVSSTDDDLESEVNALYGQVLLAIGQDPTLGDSVVKVSEVSMDITLYPVQQTQTPMGTFVLELQVEFLTDLDDPFTQIS